MSRQLSLREKEYKWPLWVPSHRTTLSGCSALGRSANISKETEIGVNVVSFFSSISQFKARVKAYLCLNWLINSLGGEYE